MGRRPGEPSIFDDPDDPDEVDGVVPADGDEASDGVPELPERPDGINLYEGLLLDASTQVPTTPAPETSAPFTADPTTSIPTSEAPQTTAAGAPEASGGEGRKLGKLLTIKGRGANGTPDTTAGVGKRNRRGLDSKIGCPPDEKRCLHVNALSEAEDKRCRRWRRKIEGGLLDDYCQAHSRDPKAVERMQQIISMGGKAAAAANAARTPAPPKTLEQVFRQVYKTQDEVEEARHILAAAMFAARETDRITPAQVSAGLAALKSMSEHIERYGAVTGSEGGHSYMRLIPGVDIVEYQDPQDAVLTGPDLEKITAGIEQDRRNGIPPPSDIADCIKRYCGREARRRDKSRYDK